MAHGELGHDTGADPHGQPWDEWAACGGAGRLEPGRPPKAPGGGAARGRAPRAWRHPTEHISTEDGRACYALPSPALRERSARMSEAGRGRAACPTLTRVAALVDLSGGAGEVF